MKYRFSPIFLNILREMSVFYDVLPDSEYTSQRNQPAIWSA